MSKKYRRKYNYVYLIENTVNKKTYIGVHKTDTLEDGYMGSGSALLNAQKKYGIENFKKEIIEFFDTYQKALAMEKFLVNLKYVKDPNTYNLRIGGNHWEGGSETLFERMSSAQKMRFKSEDERKKCSEIMKNLWNSDEHRRVMDRVFKNPERSAKISKNRSKWAKDNPEANRALMDKINKNPEKIRKTAEKHRGMKRSNETKKNVSDALKKFHLETAHRRNETIGKGCVYIHNENTKEVKRVDKNEVIPDGWKRGSGISRKSTHKDLNKGSFFGYNDETLEIKRFQKDDILPDGWTRGRPKKV